MCRHVKGRRSLLGGALAILTACNSDKAATASGSPMSLGVNHPGPGDSIGTAWRIVQEQREESSLQGNSYTLQYDATLGERQSPNPDEPNFEGTGRLEATAVDRKANCLNAAPDNVQHYSSSSDLRATASIEPAGPDSVHVSYSLEPILAEGAESGPMPWVLQGAAGGVLFFRGSSVKLERVDTVAVDNRCRGLVRVLVTTRMERLQRDRSSRCAKPTPLGPDLSQRRDAIVKGMRSAGLKVGPEHVSVGASGVSTFQMRLAKGGCILPTIESIKANCPPDRTQKGAEHLLIGAVQRTGNTTRVTARVVQAETAVILEAAKADRQGREADATSAAMAEALKQLKLEGGCVE